MGHSRVKLRRRHVDRIDGHIHIGHFRGNFLMDSQQIFDALFGVICVLFGAIIKAMWDAVRDLKTDMKDITHNLHDNFVRKDDFKDSMKEIKEMLSKIFDKLDDKVSKDDFQKHKND